MPARVADDIRTRGLAAGDVAIILSWFAVSRGLAALSGVRPDPASPALFWQLLPLELLQTRPIDSLWYLHGQPPLFNAFVASLLQLPVDYIVVWRGVWIGVGAALLLVAFRCLRVAGASRRVAHLATIAFGLNPTLILYENFLLYSYPEALCSLLALAGLLEAGRSSQGWWAYGASASVLTSLRATFQPLWSIGVACVVGWTLAGRLRRRQAIALSLPIVAGLVLVLKNGLLFGVWATSSWYGMNAAKLTATAVIGETERLVEQGVVSPVFAAGPFQPVERYPPTMVAAAEAEAHMRFGAPPALVARHKQNGHPNFNHLVYRDISRQLAVESLAAARARPVMVDETVVKGLWYFVQPASHYAFLNDNRVRLAALEQVYMTALYPGTTFVIVQLALVLTLLTSGAIALFELPRSAPLRPAAAFVLVTVGWVAVTSNLGEYGENMRLRFSVDPIVTIWLLVCVLHVAHLLYRSTRV